MGLDCLYPFWVLSHPLWVHEAVSTDLGSALFGKARRAVLGLLYARPDEAFYLRQITREVQAGQGAVQRELKRLVDAGLLTREARGREVHYRANRACPIFAELHGLVLKTVGLADVLRGALLPFQTRHHPGRSLRQPGGGHGNRRAAMLTSWSSAPWRRWPSTRPSPRRKPNWPGRSITRFLRPANSLAGAANGAASSPGSSPAH